MSRRNSSPRSRKEAEDRSRSFAVLTRMRRERLRLKPAAGLEGVQPETVRHWVGSALRKKRPRGDYYAKPYDRIPREVRVFTPDGWTWVLVRDSRTRSRIAQHASALALYVRTGNAEPLRRFQKLSFRAGGNAYKFVTDSAVIARLESADELPVEGLYREVGAH